MSNYTDYSDNYDLDVEINDDVQQAHNRLVMSYKHSGLDIWKAQALLELYPYTDADLWYSGDDYDTPRGTILEVLIDFGQRIKQLKEEIATLKGE